MSARNYYFGHEIYFEYGHFKWRYRDNHAPIDSYKRKCPRCGQYQTKNGHDPCIANLDGVLNACCGHGVADAYTMRKNDI